MDLRRDTARGIVVYNNQILLMERWREGQHYFSIPGGGVELSETPVQAVVREIAEETTIKIVVERQVIELQTKEAVHHFFLCVHQSGEPLLTDNAPEALHQTEQNRFQPVWMPLEEVKHASIMPWWPTIKQQLIDGVYNGFAEHPVIVNVG